MNSTDRLTTAELARLWGYSICSLSSWHLQGKLVEDGGSGGGNSPFFYNYPTIDTLHLEGLGENRQHFSPLIPSVAELVQYTRETGKPAFMTSAQVRDELKIAEGRLRTDTANGIIVPIQLLGGRKWLYPMTEVIAYSKKLSAGKIGRQRAGVKDDVVTHIVGIGIYALREYCKGEQPELVKVTNPKNRGEFIVTHLSLYEYLERHLYVTSTGQPLLTPREWWRMRVTRNDTLLSERRILQRYRIGRRTLRAALNNGDLPGLRTPGGEIRIPLHAADRWNIAKRDAARP